MVVNLQLPRSWDRTNCAKVVLFRAVMAKNSIEILRSSSKPISWMVVYYQAQKIFKPCLTPLVTVYGHHPKVFIMSKKRGRQHFPKNPPPSESNQLTSLYATCFPRLRLFSSFYRRISMAIATIASDSNTTNAISQNRGELNMGHLPHLVSPRPCLFLKCLVGFPVFEVRLQEILVSVAGMDSR